MSMFENKFEKALWNLRFVVILAVILSIVASITLFVIGSWDILYSVIYQNPLLNAEVNNNNAAEAPAQNTATVYVVNVKGKG